MASITVPPFTVGIDRISADTEMPRGAVRDAVNVEFDRDGRAARRGGAARISADGVSSMWKSKAGVVYAVSGAGLCSVDFSIDGATLAQIAPIASPASFCDLLDGVAVSSASEILRISGSTAAPLGVEDGRIGIVEAVSGGGFAEGRYGVALSFSRGAEEGALSEMAFVDVPLGGGIKLSSIPTPIDVDVTHVRVYRTDPGGDKLFHAQTLPAGLSESALANQPVGRQADTQHLRRMPPGAILRHWHGRLLAARGRTIFISEPMRYGLYSPRHGFVQEPHPINLLQPVEGGVYVGTRAGVCFYSGGRPSEWVRVRLGAAPAIPGTGTSVPSSVFDPGEKLGSTSEAAFWLSQAGFVIGLADGQLVQPQVRRMTLNAQAGSTTFVGRQAVSLVQ